MIKKEVVETYHRIMLAQGYSKEEAQVSSEALSEVLDKRPDMVSPVGRLLINPAPRSWIIDQPAGARMPSEVRERLGYLPVSPEMEARLLVHRKTLRSNAEKRVKKQKLEDKRKTSSVSNKGRKPNKQQRAFNSVL